MSSRPTYRNVLSTTREVLVSASQRRTALHITNEDSSIIIRIGDSTVTNAGGTAADAGLAIMPGQTFSLLSNPQTGSDSEAKWEWYAIADSGTPACSVLEIIN